jgi:hypothetical protein
MSEQVKPADADMVRIAAGMIERALRFTLGRPTMIDSLRALADVLEAEENEWAQHAEIRCELYGERCHRPGHNCASFSPDHPHVARCTDFNVSEGPE